jgi:hypothetical protein
MRSSRAIIRDKAELVSEISEKVAGMSDTSDLLSTSAVRNQRVHYYLVSDV